MILAERHGDQGDMALLLIARLRVRDALGFPPDDYDDTAVDILARTTEELLQPE